MKLKVLCLLILLTGCESMPNITTLNGFYLNADVLNVPIMISLGISRDSDKEVECDTETADCEVELE